MRGQEDARELELLLAGPLFHNSPVYAQKGQRAYLDSATTVDSLTGAAAENAGYTLDVSAGNAYLIIRTELEETNNGSGNQAGDIEYDVNGGGYVALTTVTTDVRINTGHACTSTDGAACGNVLTTSTATFNSGGVFDNTGATGNVAFAGLDHAEFAHAVEFVAANLNNGDVVKFRFVGFTGATPISITISKPIVPSGTGAQTLPSLSQSATAAEEIPGTAGQALPSLSQAATAAEEIPGAGAQTLPSLTQAANVTITNPPEHTFDTKAQFNGATDPLTNSYTCGNGATLLVLNIFSIQEPGFRTGGAPSYNGVTMTEVSASPQSNGIRAEQWYLLNPATGSAHDISVPNTGTNTLYCIAASFISSVSASSEDTSAGTTGNSTAPSQSVTPTVDGAVIIDSMGNLIDAPTGNNQTTLYSTDEGAVVDNSQYALQGTAASITFSWTLPTSRAWATVVTAFKPGSDAATSTSAQTLPSISQAASATEEIPGAGAQALAAATQAASATMQPEAAAAQTLGSVTQAGTATETITGSAAQALPSATQAASALMQPDGSAAQTLPAATQAATGSAGSPAVSGTAAQTLPATTQAGNAVMQPDGSAAQTLAAITQAASAISAAGVISSTAAQTLPATTQAATVTESIPGTAAQDLPSLTQAAVGTEEIPGTAAQTLAAATQSAIGAEEFTGSGTQALPAVTQAATAEEAMTGLAAQLLPAISQTANGIVLPNGVGAQTIPAATQAATGERAVAPSPPITGGQRTRLPEFLIENDLYAGATVHIYGLDGVGQRDPDSLAPLYTALIGTDRLPNPVTLDRHGRLPAPIYIDQSVEFEIEGQHVKAHDGGASDGAMTGLRQAAAADGDTTPSVDGIGYLNVANTAPTSVTMLDGGRELQRVVVEHENANTTVIHNATKILLSGSVNFNPAAGAMQEFVYDGAVWRELRRLEP